MQTMTRTTAADRLDTFDARLRAGLDMLDVRPGDDPAAYMPTIVEFVDSLVADHFATR